MMTKLLLLRQEVKKSIKVRDVEDEIIAVLKKYTDLAKEEKTLKKQIKEDNAALIIKIKAATNS